MLTGLRLENIALIDGLELSFDRGFTVLTGETGAGKSLLLDALDALLGGGPANQGSRLLRQGCDRGLIEASFASSPPLQAWLQAQQLDGNLDGDEPELLLSREWRQSGERIQSRSRLNGVAVNRSQLLELRPLLLELTVQGQTRQLARPGQQRRWLDRFGGEPLAAALGPVRAAHQSWKQAAAALEAARADREQLEQGRQLQQQQLEDLDAAHLDDPGERQALEVEQDRLSHGVRLQEGVILLLGRLVEGAEQAPSVLDHLGACEQELQLITALDGSLEPLQQRCGEALQQLQDLARGLERYGAALESDPAGLAGLQERIAQLKGLERRHGQDLAGLIARRDQLRLLLAPGGEAQTLASLETAEAAARSARDRACALLSTRRSEAARLLEEQLTHSLRPLGLANVRFSVALEAVAPKDDGADLVQFLFSANPGQPLAPLQEVASGGEMSRFLLALTTCLAAADPHVTLLFDEIDAGVSGRVSGAIAALLRRLAQQRQVFCVTHQPLVAAAADHHFQVSKQVEDGRTLTRVSHLRDTQARQRELAELAGGDSGEAHSYAASLLGRGAA
ncbi:DNA repair protein RecN [Synechococcus sp. CS-602]|uniref:DNA repair protein RecN n=1 Tax=Synechococcaceae TaxID=1890426 RepID=UPI0008FF639E|nr:MULTISPECIES: DNA repair protein RecN [Synechococcaceae]MCT4363801.1 DNA repair protein RecN [Candidatus Regnicoccus frigidus MAG-AL1]APD47988.1 DNA repair protein RecN [Synechococcus sp. SynAce01]MCT0201082.1 DNA repair protein RecN [Synechococcus sp. CS-603]MCT0204481.1 DNA repair protein RecN [Synechococcus sp. CS-602]MCT0245384.1 DNA repair protein RecN [Synechococcus sp. CS-601]